MNGTEAGTFDLQVEIINLRSRCEELEKGRDGLSLLRDHLEEELGKMRAKRNDAIARCEELEGQKQHLMTSCEQLRDMTDEIAAERDSYQRLANWAEGRREEMEAERDEAREWAKRRTRTAQGYKNAFERTNQTLGRFRAQLASARNDALDEAKGAVHFALFIRDVPHETIQAVFRHIESLKS